MSLGCVCVPLERDSDHANGLVFARYEFSRRSVARICRDDSMESPPVDRVLGSTRPELLC
jgi:hypothetical protein